MSNLIQEFLSISGLTSEEEAIKYIEWGQGNLEMALNYFFQKQSKQLPRFLEFQGQQKLNAFAQLKEGSKKQAFIEKAIQELKNDYKKPIESTFDKKNQLKQSNSNITSHNISKLNNDQPKRQVNLISSVMSTTSTAKSIIKESLFSEHKLSSTQLQKTKSEQLFSDNTQQQIQDTINQQLNDLIIQKETKNSQIQNEIDDQQQMQQQQLFNSTTDQLNGQRKQNISSQIKNQYNDEPININQQNSIKLNQNQSQKPLVRKQPYCETNKNKDQQQFPLQLGRIKLRCFAQYSMKLDAKQNDLVYLKCEKGKLQMNQDAKKKKRNIEKGSAPMIIRLVWNEKEIARLDQDQANQLWPLIDRNYIYLDCVIDHAPQFVQAFTQISIIAEVFLLKAAATKPILSTIEEGEKNQESQILTTFGETKDQFSYLFNLLRLKCLQTTLIQFKREGKQERHKTLDINNSQQKKNTSSPQQIESTAMQEEEKQKSPQQALQSTDEYNNQMNKPTDIFDPFSKFPKQISLDKFSKVKESKNQNMESEQQSIAQQSLTQKNTDMQEQSKQSQSELELEKLLNMQQCSNTEMKLSEPPSTFLTKLHTYQKQALTWMLMREGQLNEIKLLLEQNFRILHPLWEEYQLPNYEQLYFNPYSGQISLNFPRASNECRGGILADEMGLGKTVMMLSLIHSNKKPGSIIVAENTERNSLDNCTAKIENTDDETKNNITSINQNDKNYNDVQAAECENNSKERHRNEEQQQQFEEQKQKDLLRQNQSNSKDHIETELAQDCKDQKTILKLTQINKQKNIGQKNLLQMMKKEAKTLIIVPVTLLGQWEDEIKNHSQSKSITHFIYYEKTKKRGIDLSLYDIVITTYGIVSSEFHSSGNEKLIFSYYWYRVVLDEAHYIKGRTIQVAKAVYSLEAYNRWCLTGTPLQNCLNDLFSLIHFIRLEPWCDYIWWNNYVNKPQEKNDPVVYEVIQTIIRPVMMRRTKQTKSQNGEFIIDLPKKNYKIEYIDFSAEERGIYDYIFQNSKEEFDSYVSSGLILTKYMKVFEILMRLRQLCDHPFLLTTRSDYADLSKLEQSVKSFIQKRNKQQIGSIQKEDPENKNDEHNGTSQEDAVQNLKENSHSHFEMIINESQQEERIEVGTLQFNEQYFQEVIAKIKTNQYQICDICLCDMEDAIITCCMHVMCRLCIVRSIESVASCPMCRKYITKEDFMTVPREHRFSINLQSEYKRSAKIDAVCRYVDDVLAKNEKCVIFTQFLGIMDLLEKDFTDRNIKYLRLDGSLIEKKRKQVIKTFKEDPTYQIFMISLKSGGVGLNLIVANHAFLVDPWWNPAVEEQAVERIHRIGQKKEVNIVRFIVKQTIEERMIELHKIKQDLFDMTIKCDQKDKKQKNLENIKYLMTKY